jgi:hypothetical protein
VRPLGNLSTLENIIANRLDPRELTKHFNLQQKIVEVHRKPGNIFTHTQRTVETSDQPRKYLFSTGHAWKS